MYICQTASANETNRKDSDIAFKPVSDTNDARYARRLQEGAK